MISMDGAEVRTVELSYTETTLDRRNTNKIKYKPLRQKVLLSSMSKDKYVFSTVTFQKGERETQTGSIH